MDNANRRIKLITSHLAPSVGTGRHETSRGQEPLRVCVTGAAGQIGTALLPLIATGQMFGPDQPVILQLLEIPPAQKALEGVVMELFDCAYPLLVDVIATVKGEEAFKNADYCILVGAFPRRKGMVRADLLAKNATIFKAQGGFIDRYARKTVKVVVVGNPANTNALIASHYAPSVPKRNFSALTRLDLNRAGAQISIRCGVNPSLIENIIIWGNHSKTQYPDVNHASIVTPASGKRVSVRDAVADDDYLDNDFITSVQQRGAAVIAMRGQSSALSAANAIKDHMRDWHFGTKSGQFTSMATYSQGEYGVPKGIYYSFPVVCNKGSLSIVRGLHINEKSRQKMQFSAKELTEEREIAMKLVESA